MAIYIYNTSFFVERGKEDLFEKWFTVAVKPHLDQPERAGRRPRLTTLCSAGDENALENEAASYAFQLEFDSLEAAALWAANDGAEIVEEFMTRFAPDALTFTSVSREIPL